MPDLNFGIGFTIFYPQGEGGVEYDPIEAGGEGARVIVGSGDAVYDPIDAGGEGARVSAGSGDIEYPALLVSGGSRLHFSIGFVCERMPRTPSVCIDAVSIVEWQADAISVTEWQAEAEWKVAKCKPTR